MKRNQAFETLSHDHHDGLVFAAAIRKSRAAGDSLEDLAARVRAFWERHLVEHFRAEEEILLPEMQDEPLSALSLRLASEHEAIWKLVDSLQDPGKGDATLDAFSDVLVSHIRFEERELFPKLERALPSATLAKIAFELAAIHESDHG
jgi:hemerythrin-like domain-containing protein